MERFQQARETRTCRGKGWILYWLNKAGAVFFIALAVILSIAAFQRNLVLVNEMALWQDAVKKSPFKARPHNNLGGAYQTALQTDKAVEEYETVIKLDPSFFEAFNNLGIIYQEKGLYDIAIERFGKALKLDYYNSAIHYNMAVAYDKSGKIKEALEHYSEFILLAPPNYEQQIAKARSRIEKLNPFPSP